VSSANGAAASEAEARLLAEHVERFNQAIRTGDFGPMLEQFADDARLEFVGVPVGPFAGRQAIADAYRDQPPDDEVDLLGMARVEADGTIETDYAWRRDAGRRSGRMLITPTADRAMITRLVVTFE
jgi:steroid Delta-isomerase